MLDDLERARGALERAELDLLMFDTTAANVVSLLPGLTRSALPRVSIRDLYNVSPTGWDHERSTSTLGLPRESLAQQLARFPLLESVRLPWD